MDENSIPQSFFSLRDIFLRNIVIPQGKIFLQDLFYAKAVILQGRISLRDPFYAKAMIPQSFFSSGYFLRNIVIPQLHLHHRYNKLEIKKTKKIIRSFFIDHIRQKTDISMAAAHGGRFVYEYGILIFAKM